MSKKGRKGMGYLAGSEDLSRMERNVLLEARRMYPYYCNPGTCKRLVAKGYMEEVPRDEGRSIETGYRLTEEGKSLSSVV